MAQLELYQGLLRVAAISTAPRRLHRDGSPIRIAHIAAKLPAEFAARTSQLHVYRLFSLRMRLVCPHLRALPVTF